MRNFFTSNSRHKGITLAILLIVWCAISWFVTQQTFNYEVATLVKQEQTHTQVAAEDVADSVRRSLHFMKGIPNTFQHALRVWHALEKFGVSVNPTTLSKDEAAALWKADPVLADLSGYLELTQNSLGVDLMFVVNAAGDAIASSNAMKAGSPIGTNYSERQWFKQTSVGRPGMQYAMGKTTHKAGLYFASPILRDGKFLGAIVSKVDLQTLSFLVRQIPAFVTDQNGVVILAHDAAMELKSMPNASVSQMTAAEKLDTYQKDLIPTLSIEPWQQHAALVNLQHQNFPRLLASVDLPEYGLKVYVDNDVPEYFSLKRERLGEFFLMFLVGGALMLIIYVMLEMRRSKKAAVESATRLKLILESANSGIWGQTPSGVCTFINAQAAKMLGYTVEELIGKSLHSLVHHTHPDGTNYPQADCPMFVTGRDRKSRMASDEILWRKDGSHFDVEYATSPIVIHDELEGVVVMFHDVTERKQQEKLLALAKDKAESANRAKSDFLANMSHEIRTPMNAVIGFAELSIDSQDEDAKQSYLKQILESSKSLLGILNDILDISKIEARQMDIENNIFDLDGLLENLDRMFATRAAEKSLTFSFTKELAIPQYLVGDQLRLRQILTNLLGNSIKFTKRGGVSLEVTKLDADDTGMRLDFRVRDTGIGMTDEQMEGLFQPFVQADNSITRRFGGTGLGLSISRNLARLMGGDIVVESQLGEGSSFRLQIKLAAAQAEQVSAKIEEKMERKNLATRQENKVALQGKRVLLVEDNRVNQVLASHILKKLGVVLEIANHGGEALEKLDTASYDIVLMDIQMPVMDGLEATRRIRQDERFATLPIVAMSAGVTLDEQAMCINVGMTDFIAKPISADELNAKLTELCERVSAP